MICSELVGTRGTSVVAVEFGGRVEFVARVEFRASLVTVSLEIGLQKSRNSKWNY